MTTGRIPGTSASARRWILALASVASLMVVLDALVVSTALNTIRVRLGASVEELGWTVTAYTLSFAVLLMPAADAAVNNPRPAMNTRRRPSRSPAAAAGISSTAKLRV